MKIPPLMQGTGFLVLTGLQFVISMADWMLIVVLQIVVFELTHSAFNIMLLIVCELVPMVLFGAWAGAITDRANPKKMVVYATLARLGVILLLLLSDVRSHLATIFAIAALGAACTRFFVPAASAILPNLVLPERLPAANSVVMGARMSGMAAGTLMAGTVASHYGHFPAIAVIGMLLLMASVLGVLLPTTHATPQRQQQSGIWNDLRLAFSRYGINLLLPMTTSMLVMLALGSFEILAILYVTQMLERPAADVGLLFGAYGIGMLAGLTLASWTRIMPHYTSWMLGSVLMMCAAIWGISLVHTLELAWLLVAITGMAEGLVITLSLLRIYQQVANDFHARVIALLDTGTGVAFLLTVMFTGMVADRFMASALLQGLAAILTGILVLGLLGTHVFLRWSRGKNAAQT